MWAVNEDRKHQAEAKDEKKTYAHSRDRGCGESRVIPLSSIHEACLS
jgi:hypothetical protein